MPRPPEFGPLQDSITLIISASQNAKPAPDLLRSAAAASSTRETSQVSEPRAPKKAPRPESRFIASPFGHRFVWGGAANISARGASSAQRGDFPNTPSTRSRSIESSKNSIRSCAPI
ncbi:hypothetical protein NPIL_120631 [Nephila pilipes]|uniref:Uncharacterized protein n=1 Tax=Nephila pilipes TaxID=299642 RepID=A0A8X6T316_NEPPI|nr:hypothetical protein NPIL_120631 [Nephila pilipes]